MSDQMRTTGEVTTRRQTVRIRADRAGGTPQAGSARGWRVPPSEPTPSRAGSGPGRFGPYDIIMRPCVEITVPPCEGGIQGGGNRPATSHATASTTPPLPPLRKGGIFTCAVVAPTGGEIPVPPCEGGIQGGGDRPAAWEAPASSRPPSLCKVGKLTFSLRFIGPAAASNLSRKADVIPTGRTSPRAWSPAIRFGPREKDNAS